MLKNKDKKKISKTARRKSNYLQRSCRKTGSYIPNGQWKPEQNGRCLQSVEIKLLPTKNSMPNENILQRQRWNKDIFRLKLREFLTTNRQNKYPRWKNRSAKKRVNLNMDFIRAIMFYGVYNIEKIKIHDSKSSKLRMSMELKCSKVIALPKWWSIHLCGNLGQIIQNRQHCAGSVRRELWELRGNNVCFISIIN